MKNFQLLIAFSSILLLTSSCNKRCDDVVCESYVHRYGVPLAPSDWSERGQDGQVVSVMKDGVERNCSYVGGVLHGDTTYSFPHSDIVEKVENYDQGALTKEFWNYPSGLPYRQIVYNKPENRVETVWYDHGAPQSYEEYKGDYLQRGDYYTQDNVLESSVKNQVGKRVYRDRNGELVYVDDIQGGQIVNRAGYYANAVPESVTPYANNVPHGQRQTFHPEGEPRSVEQWVNGQQHGKSVYYQNGVKVSEVNYVEGKKQGIETRYRDDGQTVVGETNWVNDQKHGPSNSYIGNIKNTDWYYQGEKVNKQTYDAQTKRESKINFSWPSLN